MAITNLAGTSWLFNTSLIDNYNSSFHYSVYWNYVIKYNNRFETGTNSAFSLIASGGNYYFPSNNYGNSGGLTSGLLYYGYYATPKLQSNNYPNFESFIVTFITGADIANEALIGWLEINATQVVLEKEAVIIYENKKIKLQENQTAIFNCNNQKMLNNIIVNFSSPGVVIYNNVQRAIEAYKTVTFECAGKRMLDDISIKVEQVKDELAGIWTLNETVSTPSSETVHNVTGSGYFYEWNTTLSKYEWVERSFNTAYNSTDYAIRLSNDSRFPGLSFFKSQSYYTNVRSRPTVKAQYITANNAWDYGVFSTEETWNTCRRFKITSKLADVVYGDVLLSWLKENATREEFVWNETDLTGTVWYVPSGWTCKANELSAGIYGTVTLDGNTNSRAFTIFILGQRYTEIPSSASNNIWINNSNAEGISGRSYWDNTRGFTLVIDGGSDHKHPDLISWLTKHGTLLSYPIPDDSGELPIWDGSDLTDTTWEIPADWSASSGYGSYALGGTANGLAFNSVTDLYIGYSASKSLNTTSISRTANSIVTRVNNSVGHINYSTSETLTIMITGGTDVTNESLISWLKQNGELTSHQMPKPTLINFTIAGTTYQAEEGMTWKDWASSDYNTSKYRWGDTTNRLGYNDGMYQHYIQASGAFVLGDNVIINGFAYTDYKHMGGGAD